MAMSAVKLVLLLQELVGRWPLKLAALTVRLVAM